MVEEICKLKKIFALTHELEKKIKHECNLTANEVFILCLLSKGIKRPAEMAEKLDITISRISRILSSLEEKKFINREVDNNDKRMFHFELTKKGTDKVCIVSQEKFFNKIKENKLLKLLIDNLD
jgi:DNA-binding MarR family transcriptional regulator